MLCALKFEEGSLLLKGAGMPLYIGGDNAGQIAVLREARLAHLRSTQLRRNKQPYFE